MSPVTGLLQPWSLLSPVSAQASFLGEVRQHVDFARPVWMTVSLIPVQAHPRRGTRCSWPSQSRFPRCRRDRLPKGREPTDSLCRGWLPTSREWFHRRAARTCYAAQARCQLCQVVCVLPVGSRFLGNSRGVLAGRGTSFATSRERAFAKGGLSLRRFVDYVRRTELDSAFAVGRGRAVAVQVSRAPASVGIPRRTRAQMPESRWQCGCFQVSVRGYD